MFGQQKGTSKTFYRNIPCKRHFDPVYLPVWSWEEFHILLILFYYQTSPNSLTINVFICPLLAHAPPAQRIDLQAVTEMKPIRKFPPIFRRFAALSYWFTGFCNRNRAPTNALPRFGAYRCGYQRLTAVKRHFRLTTPKNVITRWLSIG